MLPKGRPQSFALKKRRVATLEGRHHRNKRGDRAEEVYVVGTRYHRLNEPSRSVENVGRMGARIRRSAGFGNSVRTHSLYRQHSG